MTDLTTAQKRYVHEIYNAGVKAYNGRAQRGQGSAGQGDGG